MTTPGPEAAPPQPTAAAQPHLAGLTGWRLSLETGFRKALGFTLGIALVVAIVLWRWPTAFSFALESTSEGVMFTTASQVDLVANMFAAAPLGGSDEPQIALEPQEVFLNLDTVYVDYGAPQDLAPDSVLGVQGIQHLEINAGCMVQIDPLRDGAMRITVIGAVSDAAADPCWLRARFWSAPGGAGLRSYIGMAKPTVANPASIELRPAEPLELRGLPISGIGFQTREHSSAPQSSLVDGALRFPRLGNRVEQLYSRDTLRLKDLHGVVDVATGTRIRTTVRGEADRAYLNGRRISPSVLEALYHHSTFTVIAAVMVAIVSAISGLRGLLKK